MPTMNECDEFKQLIDQMLIVLKAPVAHAYGLSELAQHELQKDTIDIEQIKDDIEKVKRNLNHALLFIQDFTEQMDQDIDHTSADNDDLDWLDDATLMKLHDAKLFDDDEDDENTESK